MLSQDSLERAAFQAGIGVRPTFLPQTRSTNGDALALAERGAQEWTIVAAGHQTAGRGRLGRSWSSSPGKSLLCSVVLRPELPPERAAVVSLLAATELAAACRPADVAPKWPNDLLAGGRKVAGILPEARVAGGRLAHLVLGIGVNVATAEEDFPPEVRTSATSVAAAGGPTDPAEVLAAFLLGFRRSYRPHEDTFAAEVVAAYSQVCSTIGRRVRATTTDGVAVEGTAEGVDDRGGLLVRVDGRRVAVAFGEVAHLE